MSLRTKSSLFVVVTIAAILATVQLLHAQTSLERFRAIEEEQAIADLQRVESQLEFGIGDISGTAADWAYWDASHEYILDGNQDYETANLYAEAFAPIDVDLVAFATLDGQLRFSSWFQDSGVVPIPRALAEMLSVGGALSVTERGESRSGLIIVDGAGFLVSARGITAGSEDGAPAGTLMMARDIGPSFVEALIAITNLDVTIGACGADQQCVETATHRVLRTDNQVVAQTTVPDLHGAPALAVTIRQDRDTYLEGVAGIERVLAITATIGGLAMVVAVLFVRRTVGRLERLNETTKMVSRTHDHAVRVVVEGSDEIACLAIGINHMLDGLQGANEAKTRFLSQVSHEINNPLGAISGHAQLLELDDLSDDQAESVRNILRGSRHIEKLMAQFLDTARIEAGMVALDIAPHPVENLIAETLDLIEPLAKSRSITATHIVSSRPIMAMADATRLRQILLNLITNAIKYNDPGGSVELSTTVESEIVRISVTDTGAGISPLHLERLFVPFDRLDADTSPSKGTGIGLAVSKQLVHLMGGEIVVQSDVGAGSTFTVVLPAAPPVSHDSVTQPDFTEPVPVRA